MGDEPRPRISPSLTSIATNAPGSAERVQRRLARRLHRSVDGQQEVVAGPRLRLAEHAARSAGPAASTWTRVSAVAAAQHVVVRVLDARLADLVAGDQALVARLLQLLGP